MEVESNLTEFRKLGITLREDELAALNLKLSQEGFSSVGDFVRNYATGSFSASDKMVDGLASRIASKLLASAEANATKMLANPLLTSNYSSKLNVGKEPRAGFDPATYCLQGNPLENVATTSFAFISNEYSRSKSEFVSRNRS